MLDLISDCVSELRIHVDGDVEIDGEREIHVEGTGGVVVEVMFGGPWWVTRNNSARNDIIRVAIHADVSRSPFGEPVKDDADQRAWEVWEEIDRVLHDQNHGLGWVVSSYRHSGPALTLIPNGDGAVLLTAEYETRR